MVPRSRESLIYLTHDVRQGPSNLVRGRVIAGVAVEHVLEELLHVLRGRSLLHRLHNSQKLSLNRVGRGRDVLGAEGGHPVKEIAAVEHAFVPCRLLLLGQSRMYHAITHVAVEEVFLDRFQEHGTDLSRDRVGEAAVGLRGTFEESLMAHAREVGRHRTVPGVVSAEVELGDLGSVELG